MNQNTNNVNLQELSQNWRSMREEAAKRLLETRQLLHRLETTPGVDPMAKQEIESLSAQLKAACNQIDALEG